MSETTGRIELERSIDSIVVGVRHRRDLGDITALMQSIDEVGLMQPVTITPDGVLVCGWRRLEAIRRLGRRTLNVWVRSGISDELSHVLAQQAENELRKPLSPLEQMRLYREIKLLKEEDAARRQEATRFGSPDRASAGIGDGHDSGDNGDNGDNGDSGDFAGAGSGAGHCPAPRGSGDSRNEAAQFVNRSQSYHRLEKIGWLEDVRNDAERPQSVRDLARQALDQIENGGPVDPAYKRVRAADRLASTPNRSDAPDPDVEDELARAAAEALARVKKEKRAKKGTSTGAVPSRDPHVRTPRAFVLTWTELDGWSEWYDDEEIATAVSDEEWARFERVVVESTEFVARVRDLRRSLATSA